MTVWMKLLLGRSHYHCTCPEEFGNCNAFHLHETMIKGILFVKGCLVGLDAPDGYLQQRSVSLSGISPAIRVYHNSDRERKRCGRLWRTDSYAEPSGQWATQLQDGQKRQDSSQRIMLNTGRERLSNAARPSEDLMYNALWVQRSLPHSVHVSRIANGSQTVPQRKGSGSFVVHKHLCCYSLPPSVEPIAHVLIWLKKKSKAPPVIPQQHVTMCAERLVSYHTASNQNRSFLT